MCTEKSQWLQVGALCVHLTINHSAHHFENCLKAEMCLDMEKNNLIKSANILLCFLIYFVVIFFIKCTFGSIKFIYNENVLNEKEVFNEGKIYCDIVKRRYFIKLNVKNTWFYQQILNILKISIFFSGRHIQKFHFCLTLDMIRTVTIWQAYNKYKSEDNDYNI